MRYRFCCCQNRNPDVWGGGALEPVGCLGVGVFVLLFCCVSCCFCDKYLFQFLFLLFLFVFQSENTSRGVCSQKVNCPGKGQGNDHANTFVLLFVCLHV